MQELIRNIAISLPFLLGAVFPLLALFGFFEDRINGRYRFRTTRFIGNLALIGIINAALFFPFFYNLKNLEMKSEGVAERSILKSRAASEYVLNNITVMFPEDFNDKKKLCYQAALSNYVEDQWHRTSQIELNNTPYAHRSIFSQLQVLDYKVNAVWPVAAENYKIPRQLFGMADPKGKAPELLDDKTLAEYHQYLKNCSSLQPEPWATPDRSIIQTHRDICLGFCR